MRTSTTIALALVFLWSGLAMAPAARAQQVVPPTLKGQIITSSETLQVPTTAKGFVNVMRKQDRSTFKKDADGKYTINFVAFFNRPLPGTSVGVVVLDEKKEAIAVADVQAEKGQQTLSSNIVVDQTETPKKKHILQVYYGVNNKPVVLARKEIVLK